MLEISLSELFVTLMIVAVAGLVLYQGAIIIGNAAVFFKSLNGLKTWGTAVPIAIVGYYIVGNNQPIVEPFLWFWNHTTDPNMTTRFVGTSLVVLAITVVIMKTLSPFYNFYKKDASSEKGNEKGVVIKVWDGAVLSYSWVMSKVRKNKEVEEVPSMTVKAMKAGKKAAKKSAEAEAV